MASGQGLYSPRNTKPNSRTSSQQAKGVSTNTTYKETSKGIVQRDKLELFLKEFVQNGGNATQAALSLGSYSTIQSAAAAGSTYLKERAVYLVSIWRSVAILMEN